MKTHARFKNKIIAFIFLVFTTKTTVFSAEVITNECNIDFSIFNMIALAEKHPKKEVGYSYLISFNNANDSKRIKNKIGNELFLDNRTMDCKNEKLCVKILDYLIAEEKITNLDIGAFQLNYDWHKIEYKNYFSLQHSYDKACKIITNLINKYGYSWETIAKYHSFTPKHNYKYLKIISSVLGVKNEK